ncbi:MAG TPA: hypothetical protein GX497_16600 [Bacillus bacterium]|nr:hypothetical protein [Bacillus sp. (in: firmicutes)]
MNILICEPNVPPYEKKITGKYEELQQIIGANMKVLSLNHPSIIIICNKDAYEKKSHSEYYRLNIPGTFLFSGHKNNRLRSLSEDEINVIINTIRKEDFTLV